MVSKNESKERQVKNAAICKSSLARGPDILNFATGNTSALLSNTR